MLRRGRLSKRKIVHAMGDAGSRLSVAVFRRLDSTNAQAKRQALSGNTTPALIVAETQTKGRGRLGRSFYSPPGSGIYMTLLWPVSGNQDIVGVTVRASVAVVRSLEALTGENGNGGAAFGIKWVNDIEKDGKKVCGILAEAVSDPGTGIIRALALGIGINVTTKAFPTNIAHIAGAVSTKFVDRNRLIGRIVQEWERLEDCPGDFMTEYRAHSTVLGHNIDTIRNGVRQPGRVVAIDDDGGLVVRREDGTQETLHTGEVSVRKRIM